MPESSCRDPHRRRQAGHAIVCGGAMLLATTAWWGSETRQRADTPEAVESSGDGSASVRFQLDLNRASVQELALLPGVGPALAERIVAHREAAGPFASLEALTEVHGIGAGKLRQAAPYLVVSAELPLSP